MWTFLGIASFTYLYKKSNTVFQNLAHKELVMAAALFLTVGLLLSYVRYFNFQKLRVSRVLHLPLSLLSSLPVINNLIPQTSAQTSEKAETSCKKVRQLEHVSLILGTQEDRSNNEDLSIIFSFHWTLWSIFMFYVCKLNLWKKTVMATYSEVLLKHFWTKKVLNIHVYL